ncbi:MAG: SpoIID/LytB domain-containing protein [Roseburia sp.]
MKKKLENLLSILIIMLILPLLVTIFMQKLELEKLLGAQEAGKKEKEEKTETEEIEEQLPGILANEISVSAEPEAIKAQCVIARTNCYLAKEAGNPLPEGLSLDEMTRLWGKDKFNERYQQLEQYVQETQNQILEYQGKVINAEYHAVSSGQTRTISEVVGEGEMPYLSSVSCKEDISAKGYLGVYDFEKKGFFQTCETASDLSEVEILERDSAGYVLKIKVGTRELTGEEFRTLFELPSSYFSIQEEGKKIRIITKGIGHGYGLSQNKAEKLAEEGKTYEEILNYFFAGTEIVTTSIK